MVKFSDRARAKLDQLSEADAERLVAAFRTFMEAPRSVDLIELSPLDAESSVRRFAVGGVTFHMFAAPQYHVIINFWFSEFKSRANSSALSESVRSAVSEKAMADLKNCHRNAHYFVGVYFDSYGREVKVLVKAPSGQKNLGFAKPKAIRTRGLHSVGHKPLLGFPLGKLELGRRVGFGLSRPRLGRKLRN